MCHRRWMDDRGFQIVCEIEPATTPDLTRVRHQIGVLAPVSSAYLIPDNLASRKDVPEPIRRVARASPSPATTT